MKRIPAIVTNFITKFNDNYIFKVQVDISVISTCEVFVHLISTNSYVIKSGDLVFIDIFKIVNKNSIILTHSISIS